MALAQASSMASGTYSMPTTLAARGLTNWAMVPVEQADCYRNVVVKSVAAGQVIRQYTFTNAFVVDYQETYGDTEGVGTFELVIKQKKDKVQKILVTGGYAE